MIRFFINNYRIFNVNMFIIIIFHQGLSEDNECVLNTECVNLKDCSSIKENFYLYKKKPYCNLHRDGTYVCCPKTQSLYTQAKDEHIRAIKECKSYESINLKCESSLIVSGELAEPKEFPFMALVYYKDSEQTVWLCGGSLISKKYVLTAAHCFYESIIPNWVRLGELDYNSNEDDASPQDISIKTYISHPQYFTTDIQTKYNDIALIELMTLAQFNNYVAPICLPLVDGREFQEFTTAGWGLLKDTGLSTTRLHKVKLNRFEDMKCFHSVEQTYELNKGVNNRTQICAGSFNDTRDTCNGDSGGPLFVNHPDYKCQFLIIGITSFGEGGCGNPGVPSVYTRVQLYLDWIENIVWDVPPVL